MIKKINAFFKKYISMIFLVFIMSIPILDAIFGLLSNHIYIVYFDYIIKIIFICIVLYYLIFVANNNKKDLLILLLYSVLYILINILSKGNEDKIYEMKVLIKVLYFPIVLLFTLNIKDNIDKKYLNMIFLTYVLLIFIPNILHIGHNSYQVAKEGSVGFYISANVIGNILSILYPIFLLSFIRSNKKIFSIIVTFLYFYTLLTIGTKGPLICLCLLIIYYLIYILIQLFKNKKYIFLTIILAFLICFTLILIKFIPYTAFYKNLFIHLEFLNINSFKEFFKLKNIDHFIFGSRFKMLNESFQLYLNSNIINKLFGISYTNNGLLKTCEMDYFVLLIHQGIIGFIIIYYTYFKIIYRIIKQYFKKFKENFLNIEKTTLFLSVMLSILCAFFVGHTLDVPSVAIFVSIILALSLKEINERR